MSSSQRLARWVTKQRKHYKAKQNGEYHALDDDKEKRLIDIGFCFNTRKKNVMRESVLKRYVDRWNLFIGKLQEFKDEFGHCVVPRRWKRDQELASWVMRQVSQDLAFELDLYVQKTSQIFSCSDISTGS